MGQQLTILAALAEDKKKEKNLQCHYLVAISILADVRVCLVLSCVLVLFWILWDHLADLRCVQILD